MEHERAEEMELIKIQSAAIGESKTNAVDARELHASMGVKRDFSTWIKQQIERARLVRGQHFEVFTALGENPLGGRPMTNYILSIDAAKHIAMMCRSEKGCQVRDYFIECERRLNSQAAKAAIPDLMDPDALMALLLKQIELRKSEQQAAEQQRAMIESRDSRIAALESLTVSDGSLCISDAAKAIGHRPMDVFAWLSRNRWIFKRQGCPNWIPSTHRVISGFLEMKSTTIHRPDGSEKIIDQARITRKGLARLAEMMAAPNQEAAVTKA